MLKFIEFAFSYSVTQSFAIFVSIAIFALITKKIYSNSSTKQSLLYYSIVGAFFGMWSFFEFDDISFISLGLIKVVGMFIIMALYAAVVISPFVFYAKRKKTESV